MGIIRPGTPKERLPVCRTVSIHDVPVLFRIPRSIDRRTAGTRIVRQFPEKYPIQLHKHFRRNIIVRPLRMIQNEEVRLIIIRVLLLTRDHRLVNRLCRISLSNVREPALHIDEIHMDLHSVLRRSSLFPPRDQKKFPRFIELFLKFSERLQTHIRIAVHHLHLYRTFAKFVDRLLVVRLPHFRPALFIDDAFPCRSLSLKRRFVRRLL